MINPIFGKISVIYFFTFLLLFVGIEKVISGFVTSGKSRFIGIGLGIIVIIIFLIALAYPIGASILVVLILGIALLVDGISRIIHGLQDKQTKNWPKMFSIGVWVLSLIFATAVLAYPKIGLAVAGILIGIVLLVTSIQIIAAGITEEQRRNSSNLTKKILISFYD